MLHLYVRPGRYTICLTRIPTTLDIEEEGGVVESVAQDLLEVRQAA